MDIPVGFENDCVVLGSSELCKKYGVVRSTIRGWKRRKGILVSPKVEKMSIPMGFKEDCAVLKFKDLYIKYGVGHTIAGRWKKQLGLTRRKGGGIIKWKRDKYGCWICNSHSLNDHGYPQYSGYKLVVRKMWSDKYGVVWPKGACCLHSCDNRLCINPNHVRLGTLMENQHEMAERNRSPWGMRNGGRKLSSDDARNIYWQCVVGGVTRYELAKKYGVMWGTIDSIIKGRTWWRDVQGMKNFEEKLSYVKEGK